MQRLAFPESCSLVQATTWCNIQLQMQHYMPLDMHLLLVSQAKASWWTDFMLLLFSIFLSFFSPSIVNPLKTSSSCKTMERIYGFYRSFHSWFNKSGFYFIPPLLIRHERYILWEWSQIKSSWGYHCINEREILNNTCAWDSFSRAKGRWRDVDVYCSIGCCLKIYASPTGHECTSDWAWKKGMLTKYLSPLSLKALPIAKSTSYMARIPAEPKNDLVSSTVFSSCTNSTYHMWNSFRKLVVAS